MRKGITPIIGIIVLLLIVIAIAGSAYTFLFGQFAAYTSKTIQALPTSTNSIIVKNLGTDPIQPGDITITVDGEEAFIRNPQSIPSGENALLNIIPYLEKESAQIRVTGPTNTQEFRMDTTGGIFQGLVLLHHADIDASDSSQNGNDGSLTDNTFINSSGCIGGAYQLDGVNDTVIIGTGSDYYGLCVNGCSFSVWANKASSSTSSGIVGRYDSDGGEDNRFFLVYVASNTDPRLIIDVDGTGSVACVSTGTGFSLNKWHHLVGIYNGTRTFMYVNGTLIGVSATTCPSIDQNAWQDPESTLIGAWDDEGLLGDWDGSIDELAIWNRILTQEEITDLYQMGVDAGCV